LPDTPKRSDEDDRVLLGDIGAAQGLKGEVRIRSFTQDPEAIGCYGALEDEAGRSIEIAALRPGPKGLIGRIKGVDTREAAEALTGTKLYMSRERLPARDEEEWYHADLIGLEAVDANGETIGTVTAIHNFGAGDLIEVRPVAGGEAQLVPFTESNVPEIDVARRRLTLIPPEVQE
jgi:16S rRNA processing protein RimM